MNSFPPFPRLIGSAILAGALSFLHSTSLAQDCAASFTIEDAVGLPLTPVDGELLVCVGSTLTFTDASEPSVSSLISVWEWNLNGSLLPSSDPQEETFDSEGVYTISLTISDLLGCSDNFTITVRALGEPGFTYETLMPTCFGGEDGTLAGLFDTENEEFYSYSWSMMGDPIGSGDLEASVAAGEYTVVVEDEAGCTDMEETFILEQPFEVEVSITPPGPLALCPGDDPITLLASAEFTAQGPLNDVNWSAVDGLSVTDELTTAFTPNASNLNQTLDINIVDANGCEGSSSIYLGAQTASLFGNISIDGLPCDDCLLEFFKIGEAGVWTPLTAISTNASGLYELGLVPGLTDCLLRLNAPDSEYPDLPDIYYPATHNWTEASVVTTGCNDATQKDFSVSSPASMDGNTTIEGGLFYQSSGKMEAEDPIPGVDVVVEKVPPGNAMTVVTTDVNGHFTFDFVEETLGDTIYRFYVNMPGVPMNSNHILTISAEDVLVEQVDFCLNEDSTEINACAIVSVTELQAAEHLSLTVFPNPASDRVMFKVSGAESPITEVMVTDLTGRTVRSLRPETPEFEMNLNGLSDGLYMATVLLADGTVLSERLMVGR